MRARRCWSCSKRHGSASPSIRSSPPADNQLSGRISHIECGSGQCEVLMTLADGQTLCATLPQAQAAGLAEGTEAIAYFNADRIILATLC